MTVYFFKKLLKFTGSIPLEKLDFIISFNWSSDTLCSRKLESNLSMIVDWDAVSLKSDAVCSESDPIPEICGFTFDTIRINFQTNHITFKTDCTH